MSESTSLFDDPRWTGAVYISNVVRKHLRANGDWNINDWKDVADALSAGILALEKAGRPE